MPTKSKKINKTDKQKVKTIEIDAKDKILGRMATDAAKYLQGKHSADYKPNINSGAQVKIKNASKVKVSGKKLKDKIYWSYSGYPGGIYGKTYEEIFEKDPRLVVEYAIYGMLPKNKLRKERMKRLIIEP